LLPGADEKLCRRAAQTVALTRSLVDCSAEDNLLLFHFFLRSAAGARVDHVVAGTEEESFVDEEEEDEDMAEDIEVTPGQMR